MYFCGKLAHFLRENCRHVCWIQSSFGISWDISCAKHGPSAFFFTNSGKIQFASTSITLSALVACHVLHQTSPSGRFVFSYLSLSRSTLFVNMQKLPSSMPRYVKSASFWQFNLVQVCFWAIGPIWTICGICGFLRSFAAKSPKVQKLLNFGRSRCTKFWPMTTRPLSAIEVLNSIGPDIYPLSILVTQAYEPPIFT